MDAPQTTQSLSDEMMRLWRARAYAELPGVAAFTVPALENHIRNFLERILAALVEGGETGTAKTVRLDVDSGFAKTHGGQRADVFQYPLPELIAEFHILREIMFSVLEKNGQLTSVRRDLILDAIEQAVNGAASEFARRQLEAQERFMLTMAHDLRNPLGNIKTHAWAIGQRPDKLEMIQQGAEKIRNNVTRLELMISELLDVSRIRAGEIFTLEMKEMRLDQLARRVSTELVEVHGERIQCDAAAEVSGFWNEEGLGRVIENLVVNALKYGSPETPVTIAVRDAGSAGVLSVHNEGNPIEPETLKKLFHAYSRAESARSKTGWGLGLALVKGMVDAHEGTVRVESSPPLARRFRSSCRSNSANNESAGARQT